MANQVRRFRYFGDDTELTPLAAAIMQENISFLEAELGVSWQLNQPFQFCQYCTGLAIQLALVESRYQVVDYLLSKNVDLNVPDAPAIVSAVSSLDTQLMDKIISAGADVRARNNVGYDALDQAVAWKHFELLPFLESKGLSIEKHAGSAFDSAVFDGELEFVESALKKGANPNRNKSRRQGGTGETPLHAAVLTGNFEMVKLLVRYGADVTLTNIHGQRPYHWALQDENDVIRDFLRSIEPKEFHDEHRKLKLAKKYRLPPALINFLQLNDRDIFARDGKKFADLLALKDAYEFKWRRRKYFIISRLVEDDYPCGEIVWCKKRRSICVIDTEHDELYDLGSWESFYAAPDVAIERIWSGDLG